MSDNLESSGPPPETALGPPCRHLRSSGMYIFSDRLDHENPDRHDNSIYWCVKTMTGYGPDDEMVARSDCRGTGRACYQPF